MGLPGLCIVYSTKEETTLQRKHFNTFLLLFKTFITNGWMSDVVIVVTVTNREARSPAHGLSLFLVENGMKGFVKGRKLDKIGLKAQVSPKNSDVVVVNTEDP